VERAFIAPEHDRAKGAARRLNRTRHGPNDCTAEQSRAAAERQKKGRAEEREQDRTRTARTTELLRGERREKGADLRR
jgi:hypothetical protein